ncbi:hypothetical protein E5288_WYG002132 [Bos mutus]|uniref:Uncharacterized protein n=1 Tax=Bos mutus TaxID=72004 RepID=A0A6B0SDE8_9CETA|nr:hypothetical protein [Bos mutus]
MARRMQLGQRLRRSAGAPAPAHARSGRASEGSSCTVQAARAGSPKAEPDDA